MKSTKTDHIDQTPKATHLTMALVALAFSH
jgi:hypothetical protein